MKSTFFSVAALVASAFAAPLNVGDKTNVVGGVLKEVNTVTDGVAVGGLVDGVTQGLNLPVNVKRSLTDSAGLVTLLTSSVSSITSETKILDGITSKVKSGDLTKEDAEKEAVVHLTNVKVTLTKVVSTVTGTVHLNILNGDVEKILGLVVELVTVLFTSVNNLVTVLGLDPVLSALLTTIFGLLSTVLTLVTGLVSAIVPALLTALGPILSTVTGILGPVLGPILGFVTNSLVPTVLSLNL